MKSLSCLLKGLKVLQRTSGDDVNVHRIQFDSRKVEAGDLFVAERGEVSNGHNYINAAIAKGAQSLPCTYGRLVFHRQLSHTGRQ